MKSILERIIRALGRLWIPIAVEALLASPRARDLMTQIVTSAIASGMTQSDASTVISYMTRMTMDPAKPVGLPSDDVQVYDLLRSLGVPVYGPIIEEEPKLHEGIQ